MNIKYVARTIWRHLKVVLLTLLGCFVVLAIAGSIYDHNQTLKQAKAEVASGNESADWGFFESAVKSYNEAMKLDPHLATAYEGLARSYNVLKNYDEALTASNKCIELDNKNFDCWVHKGYAAYSQDDCTTAIAALYHASMMDNSSADQDFVDRGLQKFMNSGKCAGVSP